MDLPGPIHDFLLVFLGKLLFCSFCPTPYLCGGYKYINNIFCNVYERLEYDKIFHRWTVGDGITSLVCTSLFVSLTIIILNTSWYGIIWTTKSNQILEQDLINTSQQIGIHLSTDFFLSFELISIILLVALIGAIAVAHQ
ncbi:NAD(P)H-quinone oxidoreductase subunit 6 chloroplastic [Bienertia sinuspersici]